MMISCVVFLKTIFPLAEFLLRNYTDKPDLNYLLIVTQKDIKRPGLGHVSIPV